MNAKVANQIEEQKEVVGDGRAYEVQLTERIIKIITSFPNITPAQLKSRLGPFVFENVMNQVLDRAIEDGKIELQPIKFSLRVKAGE